MSDKITVKFMQSNEGENLAENPDVALLATCIISQQAAGFTDKKGNPVVDLRMATCVHCGSPGFNSGWGYWRFTCGAEVLSGGEESESCKGPLHAVKDMKTWPESIRRLCGIQSTENTQRNGNPVTEQKSG